jgi:hypothetical protein
MWSSVGLVETDISEESVRRVVGFYETHTEPNPSLYSHCRETLRS